MATNSIAGGISFAGLGNGTDFQAMIEKLKEVEQMPMNRMKVWKADWQVRVDAFQEIMDVMTAARTSIEKLSKMSTLLDKAVESSNSAAATATADSTVPDGTYTINVKTLATSAIVSSKTPLAKTDSINTTKENKDFSYTYKGEERSFVVPPGMTLEQFANKINSDQKNPGVRANLIRGGEGYTLQLSGKDTGKDASLSVRSNLSMFDGNRYQFGGKDATAAGETKIIPSNKEEVYNYTYGGKDYTFTFDSGDSLKGFVDKFNADPKKPTDLEARVGSNPDGTKKLEFVTKVGGTEVPAQMSSVSSSVASLIGDPVEFSSDKAPLNPKPQETFEYEYDGETIELKYDSGSSLDEFITAFNKNPANTKLKASAVKATDGSENRKLKFETIATKEKPATDVTDSMVVNVPVGDPFYDWATNATKPSFGTDAKFGTQVGPDKSFQFTYEGETKIFTIAPGETLADFKKKFNASAKDMGIEAYTEKKSRTETVTNADGTTSEKKVDYYELSYRDKETKNKVKLENITTDVAKLEQQPLNFETEDSVVGSPNDPSKFSYMADGNTYSFELKPGETLADFVTRFNATKGFTPSTIDPVTGAVIPGVEVDPPYTAKLVETEAPVPGDPNATPPVPAKPGSGKWTVKFFDAADEEVALDNVQTDVKELSGFGSLESNWFTRDAQDAVFTVNGFDDQELISSSNTLTDVIDGMNITLKGLGETTLTVSTDSSALKEKVIEFVDATNTIKKKIRELTKFDEAKKTTAPEEATSQFDMQKGAPLTGNYGVQLLRSRLDNLLTSAGLGFLYDPNNHPDSDKVITLAHMGITSVADESDPMAGQLVIDEDMLDDAIKNDPTNVAELIAADKIGSSLSSDFSFADVGPTTKAGDYKVEYTVDEFGVLGDVFINGQKANTDPNFPGRFTLAGGNPAAGLAIQFDTTTGMTPGTHEGRVGVKQGKAAQLYEMLGEEIQNNKGTPDRGSIPVLMDNYRDIMDNIDKKIERETARISTWETRMKLKFSRLDALLGKYDNMMKTNESILAQSKPAK